MNLYMYVIPYHNAIFRSLLTFKNVTSSRLLWLNCCNYSVSERRSRGTDPKPVAKIQILFWCWQLVLRLLRCTRLHDACTIQHTITADTAKTLINAFVNFRIDYCNAVFFHAAAVHLSPQQSVLNTATELIVQKRKYDHITSVMRDKLHWLPVPQLIEYKEVCRLVFKYLHQSAWLYLERMCIPVGNLDSCPHLWSAARGDLVVPQAKSKTYSPCSFAIAAPSVWNLLSPNSRDPLLTFSNFHRFLRTELLFASVRYCTTLAHCYCFYALRWHSTRMITTTTTIIIISRIWRWLERSVDELRKPRKTRQKPCLGIHCSQQFSHYLTIFSLQALCSQVLKIIIIILIIIIINCLKPSTHLWRRTLTKLD